MKQGIYIPPQIQNLKDLSTKEQIILSEVHSFNSKGRECYASNEHFGIILNVKPDTVSRIISKLKKKGYLTQTRFHGRKRFLELSPKIDSYEITKQGRDEINLKIISLSKTTETDSYEITKPIHNSTYKVPNKQYNNIEELLSKLTTNTRDAINEALTKGELPKDDNLKNIVKFITSKYQIKNFAY